MGPVSTPSSTTWTVHPVRRTPAAIACAGASLPGKLGSREGWTLTMRPGNRCTNAAPRIRMKPASTTTSGSKDATVSASFTSHAARSRRSKGTSEVTRSASRARSKMGALARSLITATMSTSQRADRAASRIALKLDPRPEPSTTIRAVMRIARALRPRRRCARRSRSRTPSRRRRPAPPGKRLRRLLRPR